MPKAKNPPKRKKAKNPPGVRSKLDRYTTPREKRNRLIDEGFQRKLFSGKKLKKKSEATTVRKKSSRI